MICCWGIEGRWQSVRSAQRRTREPPHHPRGLSRQVAANWEINGTSEISCYTLACFFLSRHSLIKRLPSIAWCWLFSTINSTHVLKFLKFPQGFKFPPLDWLPVCMNKLWGRDIVIFIGAEVVLVQVSEPVDGIDGSCCDGRAWFCPTVQHPTVGRPSGDHAHQVQGVVPDLLDLEAPRGRRQTVLFHLVVDVKAVVGHNESPQASHVGIRALPRHKETVNDKFDEIRKI